MCGYGPNYPCWTGTCPQVVKELEARQAEVESRAPLLNMRVEEFKEQLHSLRISDARYAELKAMPDESLHVIDLVKVWAVLRPLIRPRNGTKDSRERDGRAFATPLQDLRHAVAVSKASSPPRTHHSLAQPRPCAACLTCQPETGCSRR